MVTQLFEDLILGKFKNQNEKKPNIYVMKVYILKIFNFFN